jgi:hypothetical protein
MATKTFYVTRDMKHPLYRTRMLRAGDELELDGPTARLYTALKAISPDKPAKVATAPNPLPITQAELDAHNAAKAEVSKTAPERKAPRKRTAKRKAK